MSLRHHYSKYWPQLVRLLQREPRLSHPLLIDSADRLARQPLRLFVVGQQTYSWHTRDVSIRSTAAIARLQEMYAEFSLGLTRPSPFWLAVRELERNFGIEAGHVLWSNLNRADFGKKRPPPELEAGMLEAFPLLPMEISLASPDVLVFFTGPAYDELLSKTFPGAVVTPLQGFGRALGRVRHPSLPSRTFRAYHPKYLRLSQTWSRVLQAIVRRSVNA